MYRVSYKHNGANEGKWSHGGAVAVKTFNTEAEALAWVDSNPIYTALKLLKWNDNIDCYSTIKEF